MKYLSLHPWDVEPQEVIEIQNSLASSVRVGNGLEGLPRYVAGVDISPPDADGIAVGAAVLLELPELQIVEATVYREKPGFPYMPEMLSFRESPLVLGTLERLVITPDVILADGQGLTHPQAFWFSLSSGGSNGHPNHRVRQVYFKRATRRHPCV